MRRPPGAPASAPAALSAEVSAPPGKVASLILPVFLAVAALSAKTAADLLRRGESFPAWFVPAFVLGLATLLAYTSYIAVGVWRARESLRLANGTSSVAVWVLLPLSFVCTSSVHQFYPFRPSVVTVYGGLDAMLRFNLTLTGIGFVGTAALAVLYGSGRRQEALVGLLGLDALLLVPNDACANPFNDWWIASIGASPLMFVPNLYASLFAFAALLGIRPRWNIAALGATCLGVALLGLGHMTRLVW